VNPTMTKVRAAKDEAVAVMQALRGKVDCYAYTRGISELQDRLDLELHDVVSATPRADRRTHAPCQEAWHEAKSAAAGRCEWCGRAAPLQGHHLHYDFVGYRIGLKREALTIEMVCDECHRGAHALPQKPTTQLSLFRELNGSAPHRLPSP
jgi:hypothetical protein